MKIYTKANTLRVELPIPRNGVHVQEIMKEHYIEFSFNSKIVYFAKGDYIVHEGNRFYLFELIPPQKQGEFYKYTLRFETRESAFKNIIFFFIPETGAKESEWSLTSNPDTFLNMALKNINRFLETEYQLGECVPTEIKTITFDNVTVWDGLMQIAEAYETEWWFESNMLFLKKRVVGSGAEINSETHKITSNKGMKSGYINRLYPYGSTRNIVPQTTSTATTSVLSNRLSLPETYIDAIANPEPEQIVEGVVKFEEIYPQFFQHITAEVRSETSVIDEVEQKVFYFKDPLFKGEPELIPGLDLSVKFESGRLNGREFKLTWHTETREFEIINTNISESLIIPNETLHPDNGDAIVFFNLVMPADLVLQAQERLRARAKAYLLQSASDRDVYDVEMNPVWMEKNKVSYNIGQGVILQGEEFGAGRESRIQRIEKSLWNPYVVNYQIGDNAQYTRLNAIEESISQTKHALIAEGSSSGGSRLGLITEFDTTPPSDYKAFSALRSIRELDTKAVSKIHDDVISVYLAYVKDILLGLNGSGGRITPQGKAMLKALEVGAFEPGFLGSGGAMYMQDGNSYLEADFLNVRKSATFYELIIEQIKYMGGMWILSAAAMKISNVEDGGSYWKCYFDRGDELSDGTHEKEQQFVANDLCRCQRFEGGSKYYWRKITYVGVDYVYISKTDCDAGSGNPEKGDDIVLLGNTSDTTRQAAIVLSTVGADSPSFKQYGGINSYSLEGKSITVFSRTKNVIKGESIVLSSGNPLEDVIGLYQVSLEGVITNLNDLSIGGRNYITNSENTWQTTTEYNFNYALTAASFLNKTVTLSAEGKVSVNGKSTKAIIRFKAGAIQQAVIEFNSTTFERKSVSVLIPLHTTELSVVFEHEQGSQGTIKNPKFEIGTRATDWTPAPEDAKSYAQAAADAAKEAAEIAANAHADGKITESEAAMIIAANAAASAAETKAKAYADGIVTASEARAITAAENYANAAKEAAEVASNAYADGKVTAEEKARIAEVAAKLQAAKDYADAAAEAVNLELKAYADGLVTEREAAAIQAAKEYTDAAEKLQDTVLKAYADGKVSEEEAARIAQATANLSNAKEYADAKKNEALLEAKTYADGKMTQAEENAIKAAKAQSDAALALKETALKAYADGIVSEEEAARIAEATAKLQAAKDYADATVSAMEIEVKAYADGKITDVEKAAIKAANDYADAALASQDTLLKAYADGKVTAEEKARIAEAAAKLQAAKDYSDAKINEATISNKAYFDGEISKAEQDAINAAKAQSDAALAAKEIIIKAYADGVVSDEEAARIEDANAKLQAAKEYADAAAKKAFDDATSGLNGFKTTYTADLKVLNEKIALKANSTTVDALGNRVGTAEATLTTQANQIASKVSTTEFNALGGRVSSAESSITQLSDSINLKVGLNDLIKGRNFLKDTAYKMIENTTTTGTAAKSTYFLLAVPDSELIDHINKVRSFCISADFSGSSSTGARIYIDYNTTTGNKLRTAEKSGTSRRSTVITLAAGENINYISSVQIEIDSGKYAKVWNAKLEVGSSATPYSEAPEDLTVKSFLDTGIDILNKSIILTADSTKIRDNAGNEIAAFTNIGGVPKLKASNIESDQLVVRYLRTSTSGPRTEILSSMLEVYGLTERNISFGVNAEGNAVLAYYRAGAKLYDLGPSGIDWGSIKPASWSSSRLTLMSSSTSVPSFMEVRNMIGSVSNTSGSLYYRYFAGSNPTITQVEKDKEKYLYTSQSTSGGKIPNGWYTSSSSNRMEYMCENTGNFIKPDPNGIYELGGIMDVPPIYMMHLTEYNSGMPTGRERTIYWNG